MPNTPVKTCNGFISVAEAENKVVESGVVELLKRDRSYERCRSIYGYR